jgi:hypothetical protein
LFPASADGSGEGGTVAVNAVAGGNVGGRGVGWDVADGVQADRARDNANIPIKSWRGSILNPIYR